MVHDMSCACLLGSNTLSETIVEWWQFRKQNSPCREPSLSLLWNTWGLHKLWYVSPVVWIRTPTKCRRKQSKGRRYWRRAVFVPQDLWWQNQVHWSHPKKVETSSKLVLHFSWTYFFQQKIQLVDMINQPRQHRFYAEKPWIWAKHCGSGWLRRKQRQTMPKRRRCHNRRGRQGSMVPNMGILISTNLSHVRHLPALWPSLWLSLRLEWRLGVNWSLGQLQTFLRKGFHWNCMKLWYYIGKPKFSRKWNQWTMTLHPDVSPGSGWGWGGIRNNQELSKFKSFQIVPRL